MDKSKIQIKLTIKFKSISNNIKLKIKIKSKLYISNKFQINVLFINQISSHSNQKIKKKLKKIILYIQTHFFYKEKLLKASFIKEKLSI